MKFGLCLAAIKAMSAAGHIVRTSHPFDGRATQLSLNRSGIAAHRRAHAHWDVVRKQIEGGVTVPIAAIRRALEALDDSAERAGRTMKRARWSSVATAHRRLTRRR
jgi:DNA-binding MarR family transcriptional regulator